MTQKKLTSLGAPGRTVRVFVERGLVRVQWRESGRRRTESWPDSRDNRVRARAFAEGVAGKLDARGRTWERLTIHQLWTAYVTAEGPAWREATRINAANHWRLFSVMLGDTAQVEAVTPAVADELYARLRSRPARAGTAGERPRSPTQAAATFHAVKRVFKWAAARQIITADPLAAWRPRLAKDDRRSAPDEYAPGEVRAIVRQLDRRSSRQWRAWVAVTLCAALGRRQRAVLGLQWADVDLGARTVRWRSETDKLGREATIPLPRAAVHALRVAKVWGARMAPGSRWVLPAVQGRRGDRPWTYQAVHQALRLAEARAGVPHRPFRALHGFRRSVVTSIHEATGDLELAGEFIGDRDVRTLRRSYLKPRPARLADAARIAGNQLATEETKS